MREASNRGEEDDSVQFRVLLSCSTSSRLHFSGVFIELKKTLFCAMKNLPSRRCDDTYDNLWFCTGNSLSPFRVHNSENPVSSTGGLSHNISDTGNVKRQGFRPEFARCYSLGCALPEHSILQVGIFCFTHDSWALLLAFLFRSLHCFQGSNSLTAL